MRRAVDLASVIVYSFLPHLLASQAQRPKPVSEIVLNRHNPTAVNECAPDQSPDV